MTHRPGDRGSKALAADASDDYLIRLAKERGAEMLCANAAFCVPISVVLIPNAWLLYDRTMKALEQKRS